MTERLHFHFSLSCIGEGNGNTLQCSCLENPRDRKPGGLPSMGSHDRRDLAAAAAARRPTWRIPCREEPGRLQSIGSQRVRHDWATSLSLSLWRPTRPSRTPQKDVLLIIGDWNGKVGSQEIPGETGKFGLGVQNEAGQRLIEFCQENALVIANTVFQQHKRPLYTWHYQMVNTKIRLIIFIAAEDGKALYSQQKQDRELTVAQIVSPWLQN